MMITLQNIHKTFGTGDAAVHALRGVSLSIAQGEMVAIMGKSGCGKSTLLNVLSGLTSFDRGEFCFRGKAMDGANANSLLAFRRNTVGFVLQHFALIDDITVLDNVLLALRHSKLSRTQQHEKAYEMLALLELDDKQKAYPTQLSGGQQQRVAIARAMVKNPDLLLADEPTGALDEETEQTVLAVLQKIHAMGKTVVVVTHDESVASICQRTIVMKNGTIK